MTSQVIQLPRAAPTPLPPTRLEARLCRLMERLRDEDDALAFEELYRLTREDVARTLYRLLGRRSDLEDLLQETYLQLMKAAPGFRGDAKVRTFLYRVCANVALMHLRWWRRRPVEALEEGTQWLAPGASPLQSAEAAQAQALVHAALSKVGAKKRIVFAYHELCGLMPEEIAQIVGAPVNTVRSRLHHARLEFTEALKGLLGPDLEVSP